MHCTFCICCCDGLRIFCTLKRSLRTRQGHGLPEKLRLTLSWSALVKGDMLPDTLLWEVLPWQERRRNRRNSLHVSAVVTRPVKAFAVMPGPTDKTCLRGRLCPRYLHGEKGKIPERKETEVMFEGEHCRLMGYKTSPAFALKPVGQILPIHALCALRQQPSEAVTHCVFGGSQWMWSSFAFTCLAWGLKLKCLYLQPFSVSISYIPARHLSCGLSLCLVLCCLRSVFSQFRAVYLSDWTTSLQCHFGGRGWTWVFYCCDDVGGFNIWCELARQQRPDWFVYCLCLLGILCCVIFTFLHNYIYTYKIIVILTKMF